MNICCIIPPAVSNTERQRQFRERNPGYYTRLSAKRRALAAVGLLQPIEAVVVKREQLLLPAPVERLEMVWMNAIPRAEQMLEAVVRQVGERPAGAGAGNQHRFGSWDDGEAKAG